MDNQQEQFDAMLKERFALLPKVVQDAIVSADVEKHLRELAGTHKLHLDQWEKLENEVQLTLLGVNEAEELEQNIRREVGVPEDIARILASDIAQLRHILNFCRPLRGSKNFGYAAAHYVK